MKIKSICSVDKADFHGWHAVYLHNGFITLIVVPDIGGRVMAYNLGDYRYFFINPDLTGKLFSYEENLGDGSMGAWKNYGGDKTWPAPQGWDNNHQWPGPPDPVLDSGRYTIQMLECQDHLAKLQMVSPPDSRTGIQITRQVTLLQGSSRVILDLSFTNITNRQIRWSIWDVAQLRAERSNPDGSLSPETNCIVSVPLNPRSRFPQGFNVMAGDENNPQWRADREKQLFIGQYLWEIGKVGIDSPGGWIAFSNTAQGYAFIEQFSYFPNEEYPDKGATVECWTTGKGRVANLNYEDSNIYLMETEVLNPLYTFNPGETRSFKIIWAVCCCEGQVVDVNETGCVHRPLSAKETSEGLELTGSFGVFFSGCLQLIWQDQTGKTLSIEVLKEVTPLEVVTLERTFIPPPQSARLELQVLTDVNDSFYTLAKSQF